MPAPQEKQRAFTSTLLECNHNRSIKGEPSWQTQRNVLTHPAPVFQATRKNTVVLTARLSKAGLRSFASAGITHAAEKLKPAFKDLKHLSRRLCGPVCRPGPRFSPEASKNSLRSVFISCGSGKIASGRDPPRSHQKKRGEIACERKNHLSNSKIGPLYRA
jgi:hypothetical protein